MTEPQPTLEDLKDINLEQIVFDELLEEFRKEHDKHLMRILYPPKKIKRRIFYEVIWWSAESRLTKCFYSAKKMRNFVNELHSWYNDYIEIEKTWCYREFTPKHKWYYISFRPNHFLCVEKW